MSDNSATFSGLEAVCTPHCEVRTLRRYLFICLTENLCHCEGPTFLLFTVGTFSGISLWGSESISK